MLASVSAFGQGYLSFTAAKSQVSYNGLYGGGAASTLSVSFLWGNNNVQSAIQALSGSLFTAPSTAISNTVAWAGTTANATAWSAILTDPNFTIAQNINAGNAQVAQPVAANGSFTYGNTGLPGSTAGNTVYAFEIAWLGGGNPGTAAAANAAVGWGNVFSYVLTASTQGAGTIGASANQFGVGNWAAPVPEPATMALGGLGALSLLLFRRRK